MVDMPTVTLPSGERIPKVGQGTWRMGEDPLDRPHEVAALRLGLDLGMTLIDTAEMYAEGGAEEVVGEAIAGRRDDVFLVTKCYPHNATPKRMQEACERSLERLGVDCIDLYLLHWRGTIPLTETLTGFQALQETGKIRYWRVSNFDRWDMEELVALPHGVGVAANQVLYNLRHRDIEWDLLPWCQAYGIPIMAYSPLDQGLLLEKPVLRRMAERHGASPAQIALAWLYQKENVITIPKASRLEHVRQNVVALTIPLSAKDHAELEHAFPAPVGPGPLKII